MKIPVSNLRSFNTIPCFLFIALVTNVIFCNIKIIIQLYDFSVSNIMVNIKFVFDIMLNLMDLSTILAHLRFLDGFLRSCPCSNQCDGQVPTMPKSCLVYLFCFDTLCMVSGLFP
jgi:hypothetical protein